MGGGSLVGVNDDPLTELTLATPGMDAGGDVAVESDSRRESMPAGFWEAMRGVVAREVREYMTTTFSENPGFH